MERKINLSLFVRAWYEHKKTENICIQIYNKVYQVCIIKGQGRQFYFYMPAPTVKKKIWEEIT